MLKEDDLKIGNIFLAPPESSGWNTKEIPGARYYKVVGFNGTIYSIVYGKDLNNFVEDSIYNFEFKNLNKKAILFVEIPITKKFEVDYRLDEII